MSVMYLSMEFMRVVGHTMKVNRTFRPSDLIFTLNSDRLRSGVITCPSFPLGLVMVLFFLLGFGFLLYVRPCLRNSQLFRCNGKNRPLVR